MSENKPKSALEPIISAYQRMIKRIGATLSKVDEKSIEQAFEDAKDTAHELGENTREEIDQISKYVKRDIDDVAAYMHESGAEFAEWLRFDVELLEDRVWDAFCTVADRTRIEMTELQIRLKRGVSYNSGEICSPGTLQCDSCGQLLSSKRTCSISPCTNCSGKVFSRLPSTPKSSNKD